MQNIKKYFMTLALLLTAVGGAWAQSTEPTEWELTSQDGKVWTLAKMPASNIELQVEYYAESNLFLGKEALADKANISVLNGSTAVTFDDAGKSTTTVTEGNTVTVTYTGSKKVIGVKAEKKAAGPNEVLTYSFDDASHPSGLTAGSRVSFDYSRTSVITNSKFLNAYNNTNGDPDATTISLGDTDLSGETWTLSFEWAACGGCNSKPDHTTLKAGDATLFDLNGNSNWNTTVTIIYTGSDGSKTLPVPGCDKSNRFTAAVGDQYNTTTYWHHIVVTGSAEGVKMTITNSSTGAAVVEDVVLSETNVNPTSQIIEPCCGGGIGIDALSLTYEE